MVKATYTVAVDWDNDGAFTGTGEDLTSRVRRITVEWGRDFASQLSGFSVAGKCSIILDNRSGDYSSFNTSSPIAGSVLPRRPVRIQAGTSTFPWTFPVVFNDHVLWQGYLESIVPVPSVGGDVIAVLEAVGPLALVAKRMVEVAMQSSRRTDQAIGDVLDAAGWASGDRDLDTGQTTMTRWWADRINALEAMREVEKTELGWLYETRDGKIGFRDRHGRLTGDALTSQVTLSDAVGATLNYQQVSQDDPLKTVFNIAECDVQLYTVGGLATLWESAEVGTTDALIERDGGQRIFWASYPVKDSPTEDIGVDAWTTPVASTDYVVNTQAGGGGSDITADVTVVVEKFGNRMKITFTNNNASDGYFTTLQARGTPVSMSDPIAIREEDATSQTTYEERTFPEHPRWIPDTLEASNWGKFVVGVHKDPQPVLRVRFIANRNDSMMHAALIRQPGDRITLMAENNATLGINRDFFIERVKHEISDGGTLHWCTWDLSDAEQFSDWWVWGTSQWGQTTRWAY